MKIGGQNESKLVSSDVSFVSSAKDQNVISSIDQYDFSSPVKLSKTPTKTIHKSPAYAFSPPLTRSAARRYNDNLGFNLLIIFIFFSSCRTKIIEDEQTPISLVTPPGAQFTSYYEKRSRQRKPKTNGESIRIRRSARLLKGSKK